MNKIHEIVHPRYKAMAGEIRKVVVGYDDIIGLCIRGLLGDGHILLTSLPGLAKTTLANTLGATIEGAVSGRASTWGSHALWSDSATPPGPPARRRRISSNGRAAPIVRNRRQAIRSSGISPAGASSSGRGCPAHARLFQSPRSTASSIRRSPINASASM